MNGKRVVLTPSLFTGEGFYDTDNRFAPVPGVQGLYKLQPQAWYSRGKPIYIYLSNNPPFPGLVARVEPREKGGKQYFLLRPQPRGTEWEAALIKFDSGDLWRSYFSVRVAEGRAEVLTSAVGGSRGGCHHREVYIYLAEVGTVFIVSHGGFKGRRPSTAAYRLVKQPLYVVFRDSKPVTWSWEKREGASALTAARLISLGEEEDYYAAGDFNVA